MHRRAPALGIVLLALGCSGHPSTTSATQPSASAKASTHASVHATARPATSTARLQAAVASWRLPAARSREVAIATAGGLVVAGGLSSARVSTPTVWTLAPMSGQLLHTGALAAPVHDASGLLINRAPLVVGGGNTSTVGDVQQLTSAGTARVVGHLPQPRSDLVAASVAGSGYVLGGFDGTTSLSAILRTSDGQHFTTVGQLRVTVRYPAVVGLTSPGGARLLVFGGEHNGTPVDDVQQVDLQSGRTRVVGHLPEPLAHEAAFTLNGVVWLVGGRSHDQLQSGIWRWDAAGHRAVAAGRLPYAVADAGLAVDASAAYVLGGESPDPTARVIVLRVQ